MINPINVNAQGIGNSYGYGAKPKSEHKEAKEAEVNKEAKKPSVAPDDVLNFMAQSAVSVAPASTKVIDPSKYVDKESEARIAGFMASFEDKVAEGLAAFDKEFGSVKVSDSSKMAVVLASIDKDA